MIPSYPCGSIGFVLGCLDENRDLSEPIHKFTTKEVDEMSLRYYTTSVHKAAFALPRFAEKAFSLR
jgi:spermidine synthase